MYAFLQEHTNRAHQAPRHLVWRIRFLATGESENVSIQLKANWEMAIQAEEPGRLHQGDIASFVHSSSRFCCNWSFSAQISFGKGVGLDWCLLFYDITTQ